MEAETAKELQRTLGNLRLAEERLRVADPGDELLVFADDYLLAGEEHEAVKHQAHGEDLNA